MAFTMLGAKLLTRSKDFREKYSVTIKREAIDPVSRGKSVFSKHVLSCGPEVRPKMDVVVLDEEERVIAVGRSLLSCKMMKEFDRGVAVKVREGLKTSKAESR